MKLFGAVALFIIWMIYVHPTMVIAEWVKAGFTQEQWRLYEERN